MGSIFQKEWTGTSVGAGTDKWKTIRIHRSGCLSTVGEIAALWIRHPVYRVFGHFTPCLVHEHRFLDPFEETKRRDRHYDQDHHPFEGQANASGLAGSVWILQHVLDSAHDILLGRLKLEPIYAPVEVRRRGRKDIGLTYLRHYILISRVSNLFDT